MVLDRKPFILNQTLYPVSICGQTNLVKINAAYSLEGSGVVGGAKFVRFRQFVQNAQLAIAISLQNIRDDYDELRNRQDSMSQENLWVAFIENFVGITAHVCSNTAAGQPPFADAFIRFASVLDPINSASQEVTLWFWNDSGKIAALPANSRLNVEITFKKSGARGI